MTNFELENKLIRLSSDLSAKACEIAAVRCQLAGREESYQQPALIEADNCIAAMQMYAQLACVAIGQTTPTEPDPEIVNATSPVWWVS